MLVNKSYHYHQETGGDPDCNQDNLSRLLTHNVQWQSGPFTIYQPSYSEDLKS